MSGLPNELDSIYSFGSRGASYSPSSQGTMELERHWLSVQRLNDYSASGVMPTGVHTREVSTPDSLNGIFLGEGERYWECPSRVSAGPSVTGEPVFTLPGPSTAPRLSNQEVVGFVPGLISSGPEVTTTTVTTSVCSGTSISAQARERHLFHPIVSPTALTSPSLYSLNDLITPTTWSHGDTSGGRGVTAVTYGSMGMISHPHLSGFQQRPTVTSPLVVEEKHLQNPTVQFSRGFLPPHHPVPVSSGVVGNGATKPYMPQVSQHPVTSTPWVVE